ncbi:MAG TPA: dicarboxylate/amino acid:cation symporter [Gemmatimonadaceae bacterium]
MTLQAKISLGLAAGLVAGAISRIPGLDAIRSVFVALEPVGTIFIRLITMVVVPLVIASLFVAVASFGDIRRLGRVGGRTLAYYLSTTFAGATIGLVVARLLLSPSAISAPIGDSAAITLKAPSLVETILGMVPSNPFAAAAQADLLPLIVAVCIFGAAATVISKDGSTVLIAFFGAVNELAMVVIGWLMRLAPPAVFILIASLVARLGLDVLRQLLMFSLVVVAALAIHVAIIHLPLLKFGARLGAWSFFTLVSDAVLLAFSTASSSAALPVSMSAAHARLGISNDVVNFVLPAGATINKNGSAIYKAVTAVFIAQLYGATLGPGNEAMIVVTATFAAFAGAGIPGSSLVTTLIVLNAIGLGPNAAAGIALVAGVDRPLDMCRTAVNTIGNLVGASLIARGEGEPLA